MIVGDSWSEPAYDASETIFETIVGRATSTTDILPRCTAKRGSGNRQDARNEMWTHAPRTLLSMEQKSSMSSSSSLPLFVSILGPFGLQCAGSLIAGSHHELDSCPQQKSWTPEPSERLMPEAEAEAEVYSDPKVSNCCQGNPLLAHAHICLLCVRRMASCNL